MAAMDRDIPRFLHFHDSQFQPFLVLIRTCQFNLISKKHLANISMPFHCSHVILSNIEFAKQTDDITQTHNWIRLHGRMMSCVYLTPHVQLNTMLEINFPTTFTLYM